MHRAFASPLDKVQPTCVTLCVYLERQKLKKLRSVLYKPREGKTQCMPPLVRWRPWLIVPESQVGQGMIRGFPSCIIPCTPVRSDKCRAQWNHCSLWLGYCVFISVASNNFGLFVAAWHFWAERSIIILRLFFMYTCQVNSHMSHMSMIVRWTDFAQQLPSAREHSPWLDRLINCHQSFSPPFCTNAAGACHTRPGHFSLQLLLPSLRARFPRLTTEAPNFLVLLTACSVLSSTSRVGCIL